MVAGRNTLSMLTDHSLSKLGRMQDTRERHEWLTLTGPLRGMTWSAASRIRDTARAKARLSRSERGGMHRVRTRLERQCGVVQNGVPVRACDSACSPSLR